MGQTPPRKFALNDLATLVNDPARTFDVLLHKTSVWIDWEGASLLVPGDAKILSVNPNAQWPLEISFSGSTRDAQAAPYDEGMEFYCKSKTATNVAKKPSRAL